MHESAEALALASQREHLHGGPLAQSLDPSLDLPQAWIHLDAQPPQDQYTGNEGDVGKRKVPDKEILAAEKGL